MSGENFREKQRLHSLRAAYNYEALHDKFCVVEKKSEIKLEKDFTLSISTKNTTTRQQRNTTKENSVSARGASALN